MGMFLLTVPACPLRSSHVNPNGPLIIDGKTYDLIERK